MNKERMIRKKMKEWGVSSTDLAKEFKVSPRTIQRWTKDIDNVPHIRVSRLCSLLNFNADERLQIYK